jgi:hypothetical protein
MAKNAVYLKSKKTGQVVFPVTDAGRIQGDSDVARSSGGCTNLVGQRIYGRESTSSNKCYNIASLTNAPEDSIFPTRVTETSAEDLWDLDIIDQTNGLLSCIRFGAGADRYIHYNAIEVSAGGTTTLTPSVITPASWGGRASESSYITIASGVATISSSAPSGTRLTAKAIDADGNMEYWVIKVS